MLSRSDQVIINMLYYVIHEIFFQSTKEWVAATNISNTTRFRCGSRYDVVVVVVCVMAAVVAAIDIPIILIIIIVNAYRDIKLVIPKRVTRYTHIQCNRRNSVSLKCVHLRRQYIDIMDAL
jgi:hypothetical protein